MRAIIQRVSSAEVRVDGEVVGRIGKGLLVYAGVGAADTSEHAEKLADKIAQMRIFDDDAGKLNLSVQDVRGGVLVISNFTLLADARRPLGPPREGPDGLAGGRRPEFSAAAPAEQAVGVHEALMEALKRRQLPLAGGVFGRHMDIVSTADGPVNIILDV